MILSGSTTGLSVGTDSSIGSMERSSHCFYLVRESKLSPWTTTLLFRPASSVLLVLIMTSLFATGVSQAVRDFISIDCGGYYGVVDPDTDFEWSPDETFLDSAKELAEKNVLIPAKVNLDERTAATRNNAVKLETAMAFFPGSTSASKYCYKFDVDTEKNYLVRAMFPNSNLTSRDGDSDNERLSGYSTSARFYFTVDSTFITTVELDPVETQTVELVVTPLDTTMYICLVPLEDRSSMPAISTLELRPLPSALYLDGRDSSIIGESPDAHSQAKNGSRTTYLITVSRLNFGGNEFAPAIRFPSDPHDRLWYAASASDTTDSSTFVPKNTSSSGFGNTNINYDYPLEVVQSAWEGRTTASNITFTFNRTGTKALRPVPSYYLSMYFYDVNPGGVNDSRIVDIYLEKDLWGLEAPVLSTSSWTWWNYKQTFSSDSPVFLITKNLNGTRPPMINAFEIYGEFEAQTRRTPDDDVSTIMSLSDTNQTDIFIDRAGDPCLPVPWSWIICSIEVPPRITQINLTNVGVNGTLPANFGSLDRLTVLDLSNNSFTGGLPESLEKVTTMRVLVLADNHMSGTFSLFEHSSFLKLEILTLRNNEFTGDLSIFKALGPESSISKIDVSNNSFNGSIPEMGSLTKLRVLDMSHNNLSGELKVSLVELDELTTLSLQSNNLSGAVPGEIWSSKSKLQTVDMSFNHFQYLDLTTWCNTVGNDINAIERKVNLSNNKINNVTIPCRGRLQSSSRPEPWFQESYGFILLGGNPYCDSFDEGDLVLRYLCRSDKYENFWTGDNGDTIRKIIIGASVSGVLVLLIACVLLVLLRRTWKRMKDLRQIQEALAKEDVRPPFFKYEELKAATRDFSEENQLGKGAFGAVYKAVLADKSVVAVKLLFPTEQNIADFLKEMVLITGIKHKHLIQLKGCCVRDRKRLLVYEFAENKNLAEALWGDERIHKLTWPQRLKICVGIARGLCYLHEELQPKIIHRDIKPQNILLDKDWDAKIADFGLARPVDEDSTMLATRIGGTLGYFSPEYATHGKLTEKLDVYSYGILVLEIVSGRQCINLSLPDQIYLKDWAFQLYSEGNILDVAEKAVLTTGSEEEITSVLKMALSCLRENHEKRPSMSQVVSMLSGSVGPEEVAIDIVGQLREQQRMYAGLFDATTSINQPYGKQEREDGALLKSTFTNSTSSSDPQRLIQLTAAKPR